MLNHFWTMLINQPVTSPLTTARRGDRPMESYTPPKLSPALENVRRILFGSDPDREFFNYRTQQLLTCVQSTELADHLAIEDSRHTYDTVTQDFLSPSLYLPTPVPVVAALGTNCQVTGTPNSPDAIGRLSYGFRVENVGNYIRVTDFHKSTFVDTPNTETKFKLGGTGYSVVLSQPAAAQHWLIEFLIRPTRALGQIVADLEVSGEATIMALFAGSSTEPCATYRQAFTKSDETPMRLAGAVLAFAHQVNASRTNQKPTDRAYPYA